MNAGAEIKHSLFMRKNGRWCITVVPAGGAWKDAQQMQAPDDVRGGSTDRPSPAAKKWRDEVLAEVHANGGLLPGKRKSSPTLRECHATLMKVRTGLPNIKTSSIKNNWTHLNAQILNLEVNADPASAIADVPMGDLAVPRARAFVRAVRARCSPNHTRNVYSTTCLLWDAAIGEGLIPDANPFRNSLVVAEVPDQENLNDDDGDPITVPLRAVQALLDARDELVPLERRARYAVGFLAGADDGEIAGFTWGHAHELPTKQLELPPPAHVSVDLATLGDAAVTPWSPRGTPHLQVRKQVSLRGKDGFATEDTPKTRNRVRDIPLHPAAVAALVAWRDRWEQLMCRKPRPKDYLFPTLDGGASRPTSAPLLRSDLRVVNALAVGRGEAPYVGEELLRLITFKAARRTFSTALKAAGVDEETRGRLMGHSGKTVTARNYTAHELAQLAEQVSKIPLLWGSVAIAVATENVLPQNSISTLAKAEEPSSVGSRRGWDSNPRMTVLQSVPPCDGESGDEPPSSTKCGVDDAQPVGMSGRNGLGAAYPADVATEPSVAEADAATPALAATVAGLAIERAQWEAFDALEAAHMSPEQRDVGDRDVKPENLPGPAKAQERPPASVPAKRRGAS